MIRFNFSSYPAERLVGLIRAHKIDGLRARTLYGHGRFALVFVYEPRKP